MKVIDLLNEIANGDIDNLPDAIKYKGNVYGYDGLNQNYVRRINFTMDFLIGEDITAMLNDELEIIEEDKKIETIEYDRDCTVEWDFEELYDKINEIIKVINEMREDE